MMESLYYLCRKQVKNFIVSAVRSPGKLALYLIIVLGVGASMTSRLFGGGMPQGTKADLALLHGGYLGVMLLVGLPVLLCGLKSGATFFRMSDVYLLFCAPISPRLILLYGLLKQLLASFVVMVLLLCQSSTMGQVFDMSASQTLILAVGVTVMLCTMQILAMMIYSLTNGQQRRIRLVMSILFACVSALAAVYIAVFFAEGGTKEGAVTALSSPYLEFVPLFGWLKGAVFGFVFGNYIAATTYMVLFAAVVGTAIAVFLWRDLDFYEDVLQSTERMEQVRRDKRAGKVTGSRKTRVTATGIKRGWGANVLFYKHLLQGRRKSRLFISMPSMVLTIAAAVFGIAFRIADWEEVSPNWALLIGTLVCCYMQFFFTLASDWSDELEHTTIYLLPAGAFQKLLWSVMTTIMRPFVEGVLLMAVLCAALGANPLYALLGALGYGVAGMLYIASSLLFQRWFGKTTANRGPVMFLYMLFVALLSAPGVGGTILLGTLYPQGPAVLAPLPFLAWGIAVTVGVVALCRNLLDTVEYNQ